MAKFNIGDKVTFRTKWDGQVIGKITKAYIESGEQFYSAEPIDDPKKYTTRGGWGYISERKIKKV